MKDLFLVYINPRRKSERNTIAYLLFEHTHKVNIPSEKILIIQKQLHINRKVKYGNKCFYCIQSFYLEKVILIFCSSEFFTSVLFTKSISNSSENVFKLSDFFFSIFCFASLRSDVQNLSILYSIYIKYYIYFTYCII